MDSRGKTTKRSIDSSPSPPTTPSRPEVPTKNRYHPLTSLDDITPINEKGKGIDIKKKQGKISLSRPDTIDKSSLKKPAKKAIKK